MKADFERNVITDDVQGVNNSAAEADNWQNAASDAYTPSDKKPGPKPTQAGDEDILEHLLPRLRIRPVEPVDQSRPIDLRSRPIELPKFPHGPWLPIEPIEPPGKLPRIIDDIINPPKAPQPEFPEKDMLPKPIQRIFDAIKHSGK